MMVVLQVSVRLATNQKHPAHKRTTNAIENNFGGGSEEQGDTAQPPNTAKVLEDPR